MAGEQVRLDIVLADDGQPAARPELPPPAPRPAAPGPAPAERQGEAEGGRPTVAERPERTVVEVERREVVREVPQREEGEPSFGREAVMILSALLGEARSLREAVGGETPQRPEAPEAERPEVPSLVSPVQPVQPAQQPERPPRPEPETPRRELEPLPRPAPQEPAPRAESGPSSLVELTAGLRGDVAGFRASWEEWSGGEGGGGKADGKGEAPQAKAEKEPAWLEKWAGRSQHFAGAASAAAQNDMTATFRATVNAAAAGFEKLGRKSGDTADGVREAGEKAKDAGEKMGQAAGWGGKVAAGLRAASTIVESFGSVVQSFVERGKQLQDWSPQLAASNARAEIASMIADMREAQELGGDIGRLQDAQTELMGVLREALLPVKKALIGILIPLLEGLVELVRNGYIGVNDLVIIAKAVPELLYEMIRLNGEGLAAVRQKIGDEMEKVREQARGFGDAPDDPFEKILGPMFDRIRRRAAPDAPPAADPAPAPDPFAWGAP